MKVRWTAPASQRLEDIFRRIQRESPSAAQRIRRTIRERAAMLGRFPDMGRPAWTGTRELVVSGTPRIIVYFHREREVIILNVKHAAQDWEEVI